MTTAKQYPEQLAGFGPILLRRFNAKSPITLRHEKLRETRPIVGARATLEPGEALESRITATRLVLVGPFALAWRKKKGGEFWLTVEGEGFFWMEKVERRQIAAAREFVAKVNNAAASAR